MLIMEILSEKTVKTRKPYRCHCCGVTVTKDNRMKVQVNVYDGINTVRWCLDCDNLCDTFRDVFLDADDVFPEDCVKDMIDDYKRSGHNVQTSAELFRFLKNKQEYYESEEADYQFEIDRDLSCQSQ